MKRIFDLTVFAAVVATTAALAMGCSSASGPSLNPAKSDCNTACAKNQECVAKDSNVTACTDKCDAKAKNDDVYRAKVKACAECVEPRACSELSTCVDDCLRAVLD